MQELDYLESERPWSKRLDALSAELELHVSLSALESTKDHIRRAQEQMRDACLAAVREADLDHALEHGYDNLPPPSYVTTILAAIERAKPQS